MKDNLKSRPLVEGAILAAVLFIIILFSMIPTLLILGMILAPIPIAILYIKNGAKISILSFIAAVIIASIAIGPINSIGTALTAGCVGFPIGYGVRNKKSATNTLIYIFILNTIGQIITWSINIYLVLNTTLYGLLQQFVNQYKEAADIAMKSTTNEQVIKNMHNMLSYISVETISIILPTIFLIYIFVSSLISFVVSRMILARLNFKIQKLRSFKLWYTPPVVIAGLVLVAVLGIGLKTNGFDIGQTIFLAVIFLVITIMTMQGVSLVAYFLSNKLRVNNLIIVIACILLFVTGMFIYLFILGLADVLLDYRSADPDSLGCYIRKKINNKNS